MKRTKAVLFGILLCYVGLFFLGCIVTAVAENAPWDCPECGRTGNTGNYCGGCAHPAPWRKEAFQTVGNIVRFGHYEQDNNMENGKESIEWLVLDYDAKNNRTLLLSRFGLDAQPYNKENISITWEKCTLRTWLNSTFQRKAFTTKEQACILRTNVDNGSNQGNREWNTSGGNNTEDKIFLMSYAEVNMYLSVMYDDHSNTISRVAPTAYANKQGAYSGSGNKTMDGADAGWWWLRFPGFHQNRAASVNNDGSLYYDYVSSGNGCVRPAFWIDLESGAF